MTDDLFFILCTTLPSHIIPFTLFWNFRWRSRNSALLLVCINVLCKMAAAVYFLSNGLSFRGVELMFSVSGFLVYVFLLLMDPFKMLFTFILIVDYLLIVRGIAGFTVVHFMAGDPQGWQSGMLCVLLYCVSLPFLLRFFRRVASQVYHTDAPQLWRIIWLIPALLSVLTILFTNSYLESSVRSWFFICCRISLLICVFVIYHVLLQALESLQKQAALQQKLIFENRIMEMQMEEQKKYSQLLMETAEQTRRQRHDLRHQLITIQSLTGPDNKKLSDYINTLVENIPPAVSILCENPAVNAIISHYSSVCSEDGIDFSAALTVPSDNKNVSDSDLCIIFGNLLENAVEACQRMGEGRRFIRLRSSLRHDTLIITLDNSFGGTLRMENGVFYSVKRAGTGIGLSSVQAVARKYHGYARFEPEGDTFRSSIYIQL